MSAEPRRYREMRLRDKLTKEGILGNPYTDQATVAAAELAIKNTLDRQDIEIQSRQRKLSYEIGNRLGGI